MKSVLPLRKALLLCATVLLGLSFSSWKQGTQHTIRTFTDTVPAPSEKKIQDIDDALKELDHAHADLDKSIKEIDWDKMRIDMNDAMKDMDVNMKKMNDDLKKSLQQIDVDKMKQDMETSVAKIDWDNIKAEIEKAKAINMDSVKANMEAVKQHMETLKPQLEKNLQEARKNMEKAKSDMQEYKGFIDGLERDGLINKKDGYTIENKDGQLIINGKQQSSAVYNKYRTFLEKHKNSTITKNENGFNINTDK